MSERLSAHFELREFTSSQTAERLGRPIEPTSNIIANLRTLCTQLLEPVRVKLARPMVITSGYRPEWLNEAIGGSKTSAHVQGLAADVKVVGMSPLTFCRWVKDNWEAEGWPIDQCIYEGSWTHLGMAAKPRGQFLTAKFTQQGVQYTFGLGDQ